LGPHDEEASGIDFIMRTIGRKFEKKEKGEVEPEEEAEVADPENEAETDEDDEMEGSGESAETAEANKNFERMVDPSLLSPAQLQAIFGDRAADLSGVFFQHSTRIAERAEFFPRAACFTWRPTDRAHARRYCKGQVHPAVYISALRSALSSSNMPLSQNEVLVDLTGGTPESIVAAVVVGFKKVFYVGDENEQTMMSFPTPDEVVDWNQCPSPPVCFACHDWATQGNRGSQGFTHQPRRYTSPDMTSPNKGVLAAAAVRLLAPYLENAIFNVRNADKVDATLVKHRTILISLSSAVTCHVSVSNETDARSSLPPRSQCHRFVFTLSSR
jgi:hypothetical protein